jgi:O-antigen/teichoic acid export membrane protein
MGNIAYSISKEIRVLTAVLWARIVSKAGAWSGHLKEYFTTFVIEVGVMISQMIVYKLAARFLGKEGFSQYAVARRTIALIYPIALLGLTVALPRFVARAKDERTSSDSKGYFGAALVCVVITTGVVFGIANYIPTQAAELFFGAREFARLVFPLSVMVAGLTFHTVAYGYFRGNLAMEKANALQLVNLGLIPPLVFVIQRRDVRSILLDLGTLTFLVAGITIFTFTPWQEMIKVQGKRLRELLGYGLQRLPGDLALLGLFTVPITITAHVQGVQQAGFLAFGMLFLTVVSAMFNPIGLILLPKASRMFAAGASFELRHHFLRLLKITVLITGSISIAIGILATPLIRIYLGPDYSIVAGVVRFAAVGTIPYCIFLLSSHIIDAFHRNSVTAGIEFIAFIVACLGCCFEWFGTRSLNGFLAAFLGGVFTLGTLSSLACLKIFRREAAPPDDQAREAAVVGGVFCE